MARPLVGDFGGHLCSLCVRWRYNVVQCISDARALSNAVAIRTAAQIHKSHGSCAGAVQHEIQRPDLNGTKYWSFPPLWRRCCDSVFDTKMHGQVHHCMRYLAHVSLCQCQHGTGTDVGYVRMWHNFTISTAVHVLMWKYL